METRAEIEKYFRSVFGLNENFEIYFRDWLTFIASAFLCLISDPFRGGEAKYIDVIYGRPWSVFTFAAATIRRRGAGAACLSFLRDDGGYDGAVKGSSAQKKSIKFVVNLCVLTGLPTYFANRLLWSLWCKFWLELGSLLLLRTLINFTLLLRSFQHASNPI